MLPNYSFITNLILMFRWRSQRAPRFCQKAQEEEEEYFWLDLNSQRDFGQTLSRALCVHRSKAGYVEGGKRRKEGEEEGALSLSLSSQWGVKVREIMAFVAINSFLPCMDGSTRSNNEKSSSEQLWEWGSKCSHHKVQHIKIWHGHN